MDPKPVDDSRCIMTEIVLPNDTNGLGTLMGGRLLHLMDKCAAISAQRHSHEICVTASVDNVEFTSPIWQNEVILVESQVNRVFRSSMEVELNVWAENPRKQTRRKCNRAYYTFVALNEAGETIPVAPIDPQTQEEKDRYVSAARRREVRLALAGRIDLGEAQHIQRDMLEALIKKRDQNDSPEDKS